MTKRMLIDSTHSEETRVVVLDGNRLEDFDVETSTKQQLKGNIYLAKVVRVEPSLQAAFVEYGGNRHGFLAFGEIHPDYYQIPVADRQRLLEMQEAEAREDEEAEDRAAARDAADARSYDPQPNGAAGAMDAVFDAPSFGTPSFGTPSIDASDVDAPETPPAYPDVTGDDQPYPEPPHPELPQLELSEPELPAPEFSEPALPHPGQVAQAAAISQDIIVAPHEAEALFPDTAAPPVDTASIEAAATEASDIQVLDIAGADMVPEAETTDASEFSVTDATPPAIAFEQPGLDAPFNPGPDQPPNGSFDPAEPPPESMGGETEEPREQRAPPRFLRNYKIQEVIRRRQILLIQVVKEERGTKGAALTTYISLAGRFSVLMPNSPRGGGISRKITSASDRRRLKEVTAELDLPRGMGLIVRTAGANRPKPEIIRDCEYLLNQWDQIRDLTMKSVAPALIYEEASLIKRAIRDVYSRDVDDILVDGETGWRAARDFMRMLMPTHARKVQLWKDPQPLFVKAQVEAQLDAMLMPTVQLKSGGYLVINQTEALVAIDVNSGRSTRERGIEETALKTNLEAADEAARQLRLRDLAGLIVIDFIDMESRRNNTAVEARLKTALKNDRARIQVGSISHFGLMEMSRQRLRPSLAETSLVMCPHCAGSGHVRSTESAALHVLRGIEEEGAKRRAAEVIVHVAGSIALYILNYKRVRLTEIETRYGMRVAFAADDTLLPPAVRIDRVRAQIASELPPPISQLAPPEPFEDPDEESVDRTADANAASDAATGDTVDDEDAPRPGETAEETEQRSGRRRRRRRGGRREDSSAAGASDGAPQSAEPGSAPQSAEPGDEPQPASPDGGELIPAVEEAVMHALVAEPTEDDAPDSAAPESAEATSGDDAERSKRRGRRGGRRRRRDPGEGAEATEPTDAANDAPAPAEYSPPAYTPPVYAGPTPADPFGGTSAFDIFDAIEQAEQERALATTAPVRRAMPPILTEPEAMLPTENLPSEQEPVIAEPIAMAPETVSLADPDPIDPSSATEPAPVEQGAEPVAPSPAIEPADQLSPAPLSAPLIQPVLIDGTDASVEKKRGWWRR